MRREARDSIFPICLPGKLLNGDFRDQLKETIAKIANDDTKAAERILGGWYKDARSAWSGFGVGGGYIVF